MSGDATQTLPRRADAPSFDEYLLRGASDDTPSPVELPAVEVSDVDFWGVDRKKLLNEAAKLRIRQVLVATAMVAALTIMVLLVTGAESEIDGSTLAADASPSSAEAETSGIQSSSVEPQDGVDQAQALARSDSPMFGLAEMYSEPSETPAVPAAVDELPTTASPTTVPPTTVAPTTAVPTTAAPTTAAPTTVAPSDPATSTEPPSESAEADQSANANAEASDVADGEAGTAPAEPAAEAPADAPSEPVAEPATPAHPEGWVDAGHGVYVPPVMLEIRRCESTHNYTAANPSSSARGAYQFLRGSWADYGHRDRYGVAEAHLATPAQQDEAAVITWQRSGTRPWNASKHCWG